MPSLGWELYMAWCAASGHDLDSYSPDALTAFWEDVPVAESTRRKREAEILRALAARGADVPPPPGRFMPTAWRSGDGWVSLQEALSAIPTVGYPGGLRGRRDAFLLVLIHRGLTREQARNVVPADFDWLPGCVTFRGAVIDRADDPERCPACAIARWLRAYAFTAYIRRHSLRETLIAQAGRAVGHVCDEEDPGEWKGREEVLVPAVDAQGKLETRPVGVRMVSAILELRQAHRTVKASTPQRHVAADQTTYTDLDANADLFPQAPRSVPTRSVDELFDDLDEKLAAADALLARIEADDAAHEARMQELLYGCDGNDE